MLKPGVQICPGLVSSWKIFSVSLTKGEDFFSHDLHSLCLCSQTTEWGQPAGVFCQWQQQWQRQRCWGQQDRDQSGHTTLTCGMCSFVFIFGFVLYVRFSLTPLFSPSPHYVGCENHTGCYFMRVTLHVINITQTTTSPEQAELIVIGSRHGRGGLGPVGWLRRVLAGAAEAAGGGPGGAGPSSTYGTHAGWGGETNPAAQTFPCGRLG